MITLRDYQNELLEGIYQSMSRNNKRIMVQSPAGSGKTVTMSELVRRANLKRNRVLTVVHRNELVSQIRQTFNANGVDWLLSEVGMVQTISNRVKKNKVSAPEIIVIDEAHHALSKTYRDIIQAFPKAYVIGFTATPYRLNGQGFTDLFDDIVLGKTVKWLIENKRLAPFKYLSIDLINHEKLKRQRGEYTQKSISEAFTKTIYGDALESYEKYARGLKTIIYAYNVESSKKVVERFQQHGYKAYHLDGKAKTQERLEVVEKFRKGEIDILTNAELFGEGFDIPDCHCVILLRPTESLSLFIQQTMRAMRYQPNKQAIIIDLVNNWSTHKLPDTDRDWQKYFKGKPPREKSDVSVKQCPNCLAVIPSGHRECPLCEHEFESDYGSAEYAYEKVELEEITEENVIKLNFKKPSECKSMKELYELAESLNYKKGWAYYQGKALGLI
ncbi:DEAD/DEAH box helicase [Staphylococcus americanisciuri]|uniref:DEAD/DEAH box helicase n=1 Tax=Staphylococcus americanisciuri TaxID=2973940 RepID=A0ABT2F438_9STAP|nr:DEAD/DEAH box helicase [Staphylococcus americanisciuri]MCS4487218.1 DEAD/DEAH box helicase [Staphylococcus americanisciuri]